VPKHLRAITELAEDVVRASKAIIELKRGKDGANVAELARLLEKSLRKTVIGRVKARRRAARSARDVMGRFR